MPLGSVICVRRHPIPLTAGPDQESVWDYPRPPAVEPSSRLVEVVVGGETIASTRRSIRVLETSHPPVYYVPPEDVRADVLVPEEGRSVCEWKGTAIYLGVRAGGRHAHSAVWSYPRPLPGYEAIAGYLAFYPGRVDGCFVDGVRVQPQEGGFYGGWITPDVVGPFKGEPGTFGW